MLRVTDLAGESFIAIGHGNICLVY